MRRGFDPNAQDSAELYMVGQKGEEGREGGNKEEMKEGMKEGMKDGRNE